MSNYSTRSKMFSFTKQTLDHHFEMFEHEHLEIVFMVT